MITIKKENELINTLSELKPGDKITIVGFNDFGMPQVSQTTFHDFDVKETSFQTFIYLIHRPKHKRKYYKKSLDQKDIIILNGWVNVSDMPTLRKNENGYEYVVSFDDTFMKDVSLLFEKEILFTNIK